MSSEEHQVGRELLARLRLAGTSGVSPRVHQRLLRRFGSADALFAALRRGNVRVAGVEPARIELLRGAPREADVRRELEHAARHEVEVLWAGDPRWPPGLAELADPPLVLYARGGLTREDGTAIAIVGSRRASPYGLARARRLAGELATIGFTVVSGLARGIDAAAHRGALEAGGRTVAVLGGGLARFYPSENLGLAREIVSGRGAVLTEFPLDWSPRPYNFPRRNRIIAAISRAVVVVEAGEKSGSLITADHALDIGREVLAVPGRIDHPNTRGTHRLLREGAALCETAADVLVALGVEPIDTPAEAPLPTDPVERTIFEALAGRELHADELVEITPLEPEAVLEALSSLELCGTITVGPDGRYARP